MTTLRLIAFVILSCLSIMTPYPVFIFLVLLYVFFWSGYELITIGLFVETVFAPLPWSLAYLGVIAIILLVSTVLRPMISWYRTPV